MADIDDPYKYPVRAEPPLTAEDKQWAVLAHMLGIVFGVVSAGVFFFVLRDRGPFVKHHVTTQLNFQLTVMIVLTLGVIASIASVILAVISPDEDLETSAVLFSLFFYPFCVIVLVQAAVLILGLWAALSASRGALYTYPAFRFVK